jgi:methylglutaconyl-CoA hydratase
MTAAPYKTIEVKEKGPLAELVLARPEVKNAFDENVIRELTGAIRLIGGREDIRVMVLSGRGDAFSAGADLGWMRKMAGYSYEENMADAGRLADLMEALYTMPQATIARVNGPTIGGGLGLVSACDIAVASSKAFFALREVRLGITPAVISPYVIRKIGERNARDYFLTGRRMDAAAAEHIGLVNEVASPEKLDEAVGRWAERFLHCGPEAVRACKELIARVSGRPIDEVKDYTADMIARLRASREGQEGFAAFFDKRKPNWDTDKE